MENYRGLVLKSGPCFGIFPQKKKKNKKKTRTLLNEPVWHLPQYGSRTGRAGLIVCEQRIWMEVQPEPSANRKPEERNFNRNLMEPEYNVTGSQ